MRSMRLLGAGQRLSLDDLATPEPGPHQVLVEVLACGVCRTNRHLMSNRARCSMPQSSFAAVGALVPAALAAVRGGGRVV
jgi:threonine dehydrogenase-like Zn-dependent dehydrogenase